MSERSVAQKLLIREGQVVALIGPPDGSAGGPGSGLLGTLPAGVRVVGEAPADVVLLFVRDRASLEARWAAVADAAGPATILWLCYPKRGHGIPTDLTRDQGWAPVRRSGFDPVTQVAIDETWSALRWRRDPALRAAREARGARVGRD